MDAELPKLIVQSPQRTTENSTLIEDTFIGRPASTLQRVVTLAAILLPFVGLIVSMVWFWQSGIGWTELGLFIGMYLASGLGVTVGYHRLFAHRSFETFAPVRAILAILGAMAVQGPVLRWVAVHRRHHQYSDQDRDPHSPNTAGGGIGGIFKGFMHAHMGWMFEADHPRLANYVRDLQADKVLCAVSRLWEFWALLGLLIPTVLGGVIAGSWTGAFLGFLWGGLVRIFFVHHMTWSINSVCHIWGHQTFDLRDHSKNNPILGVLGLGEGWHNNHHAFPSSARHGLAWWQIDFSFIAIRIMQNLGLAWRVQVASAESIRVKKLVKG